MIEIVAPYMSFWLKGAALTLGLSAASFPSCVLIGLTVAFAAVSRTRAVSLAAAAYINVFRGLPEIIVIFVVFYGSNIVLTMLGKPLGFQFGGSNPAIAALVALSVQFGSYAAVIFKDWMAVFPKGYTEAGLAIGMTRLQIRRRIVVPLLLRSATPALGNLFLVMLKISALASLIGVAELSRTTSIIAGSTREPLVCYLIAAVMYLAISAVSGFVQHRFEAAMERSL
ncbi:His/Glu/Gln/Arg/opine family amino acid ABC transporter permease subunit [Rhizobium mongolense]|uniref:His/Glu/Gln/Arg/opine family amino acid ABC transporter permease subunit n=2 Tax=Rhizobium mongolense TaxID=57676 RepID=A0ABR6IZ30_9HYPH|nr:His/Glu/Gln/Arg/opine family amino acid ABC transporter permease subunit [Rhizobium mongolense]TVZ74969.1 polar amino acid transport system permease protein/octopine/nopaline transport system permease protein/arginine/ornithine transport system permease protein [Rhizobium mongolense USDA 1844]